MNLSGGAILRVFALAFLLHLFQPSAAAANTIAAASCSLTDVQNAVNAANDRDVVTMPACGPTVWNGRLTIPGTKGIVLQGAGCTLSATGYPTSCLTNIVNGGTTETELILITSAAGRFTRLTAFSVDANLNTSHYSIYKFQGDGIDTLRLDHTRLLNLRGRGVHFKPNNTSGAAWGWVIDHNYIGAPAGGTSVHGLDCEGGGAGNGGPWTRPYALGSSDFVFAEDNFFDFAAMEDGVMDAYNGCRLVFRNNKVEGTLPNWHGADSGFARGIHSFELYRNTFNNSKTAIFTAFNYRSGTGMQWGNSWTGGYNDNGRFQIYRVTQGSFAPWGACNGTSTYDGNLGSGTNPGWPCLDQTGWMFSSTAVGSGGTFSKAPTYMWLNTKSGSPMGAPGGTTGYIVADREFYNGTASFNGSSGVGTGVLSNRPSTCTAGVGYWATDQGEWDSTNGSTPDGRLYVCTSTNIWSLYYTPYAYPHPLTLVGNGLPQAPANLRVIP